MEKILLGESATPPGRGNGTNVEHHDGLARRIVPSPDFLERRAAGA